MKKIANLLIIFGVGVVTFSILYSIKISHFSEIEAYVIMFLSTLLILLGLFIKMFINRKQIPYNKFYFRLLMMFLFFTSITYFLVKSLI